MGSDWLQLGPSGPRRLRLAIEHLAQVRGGICFQVDLDPRWVVKLLKRGDIKEAEAYKKHCIDQAVTVLDAHPEYPLSVHDAQTARRPLRPRFAQGQRHHGRLFAAVPR